ncbi:hypothetical protein B0J14DRAFT_647795 [Halenospora varia]|nr:hypothetical protein B0J14DRAFT_647795 [Halenospora varia]
MRLPLTRELRLFIALSSERLLIFPNEEWSSDATEQDLEQVINQLSPSISFSQDITDNIQTLSTQNADKSGVTSGFLYVPDLDHDDPCYNISQAYLPANVTRQANLPPTDFTLIAIAPWINANCTRSYLKAARSDPNRGFIFYLPDNETSTPPSSSSIWDLEGGGSWRTRNQYPVYAIPGHLGRQLVRQSSMYSGNMTTVPYGHDIASLPNVDPRDYVRLYTEIDTTSFSTLPQLWMLILIVLAVLVFILGAISAAMHLIQVARRRALRRRVANGEVNLEALGIKRLTVPQEFIDDLPIFLYNDEGEKPILTSPECEKTTAAMAVAKETLGSPTSIAKRPSPSYTDSGVVLGSEVVVVDDDTSGPHSVLPHKFLPYSQPTCPICLDDFVSGQTEIRELPCGHIFHPDCIDQFLSSNSSLCPMCKQSALPIGYCPERITNSMVRRERNLRRLRARVRVEDGDANAGHEGAWGRIKHRFTRASITDSTHEQELSSIRPPRLIIPNPTPIHSQTSVLGTEIPQTPTRRRQEMVAARIRDLVSRQGPFQDPEAMPERQRPKWRKSLAKVFPGF